MAVLSNSVRIQSMHHFIILIAICFVLLCSLAGCSLISTDRDDAAVPETPVAAAPDEAAPIPANRDEEQPPAAQDAADPVVPVVQDNEESSAAPDSQENVPAGDGGISENLTVLSPEIVGEIRELPWDMEPEVLNAVEKFKEGNHFPVSDEKHPDLFKEVLTNKGGTYIGVGTDQTYVFIGWMRPTLVFATDYDPWAVFTNMGYAALFRLCDDIECFKSHLRDKEKVHELMLELYKDHPLKKAIAKRFRSVLYGVRHKFDILRAQEWSNFANDPEIYSYIRDLVRADRFVVMQANLLDSVALNAISEFLKKHHRTVSALYVSNAEQYWGYSQQYKDNMLNIPWHEDGFIMRTHACYPKNTDYKYSIQPAGVFTAWLKDPRSTGVKRITKHVSVRHPDEFPFTVDDIMPEDAHLLQQKARHHQKAPQ